MKSLALVSVAFVIGTVAGVVVTHGVFGRERLASLERERNEAQSVADKAKRDAADSARRLCEVQDVLKRQQAHAQTSGDLEESEQPDTDTEFAEGTASAPEDAPPTAKRPAQANSPANKPGSQDVLRERRQAYLDGVFERELAAAPDTEASERLTAMRDQQAQIQDLRAAARTATSEDERSRLLEQAAKAAQTYRELVKEYQDYLIRGMAGQYGITDASQQEAFVQSVRSLQSNAFFRATKQANSGVAGLLRRAP